MASSTWHWSSRSSSESDEKGERSDNETHTAGPKIIRRSLSANTVTQQLSRTIETEVIPRLMLAHQLEGPVPAIHSDFCAHLRPEDVTEFARLLLRHDLTVASSYVNAVKARGTPLEAIFLDLLAPAAQLLGEYWEQDLCDFAEVTVGLCTLQQLLRQLNPTHDIDIHAGLDNRRALVAPTPGEQHSFGVKMVEEFFRSDGWDVSGNGMQSSDTLVMLVQETPYAIVGLSLANESHYQTLRNCISDIRHNSRNPTVGVMVGGPFFLEHPELVLASGADLTASNGADAVSLAKALVDRKKEGG
jgi:methanogenic corrinoid protein MtbC1